MNLASPASSLCILQTQDNMFTEALTGNCHKSTRIMQLELCEVVSYFSRGTCPYQKPDSGQSEAQSIKKKVPLSPYIKMHPPVLQ